MANLVSKLNKLASQLVNTTAGGGQLGFFNLSVPSSLYSFNESENVTTIGGLANKLVSYVKDLKQMTNTAFCAISLALNPADAWKAIKMITAQLGTYAASMATQFATLFANQINQAFYQYLGTGINLIKGVLGIVSALGGIVNTLYVAYNNLKDAKFEISKLKIENEKCEAMFAAIAACYLNKMFGDKISEFERKVNGEITKFGTSMNESVAKSLEDVNVLRKLFESRGVYVE